MKRSFVVEEGHLPFHPGSGPAIIIATLSPEIKKLVRSSIDTLLAKPHTGSELTGELEGYRSLKAKRYRIIYRLNDSETSVYILSVIGGMFTIPFGLCSSRLNNNRELKAFGSVRRFWVRRSQVSLDLKVPCVHGGDPR
jgi:mRNA-degrading endonuclease RelE of RelBE toxin-antitoxin system